MPKTIRCVEPGDQFMEPESAVEQIEDQLNVTNVLILRKVLCPGGVDLSLNGRARIVFAQLSDQRKYADPQYKIGAKIRANDPDPINPSRAVLCREPFALIVGRREKYLSTKV